MNDTEKNQQPDQNQMAMIYQQFMSYAYKEIERINDEISSASRTLLILRSMKDDTEASKILINVGSNLFLKLETDDPIQKVVTVVGQSSPSFHYEEITKDEAIAQVTKEIQELSKKGEEVQKNISDQAKQFGFADPFGKQTSDRKP